MRRLLVLIIVLAIMLVVILAFCKVVVSIYHGIPGPDFPMEQSEFLWRDETYIITPHPAHPQENFFADVYYTNGSIQEGARIPWGTRVIYRGRANYSTLVVTFTPKGKEAEDKPGVYQQGATFSDKYSYVLQREKEELAKEVAEPMQTAEMATRVWKLLGTPHAP